jgi:hypothetical protein
MKMAAKSKSLFASFSSEKEESCSFLKKRIKTLLLLCCIGIAWPPALAWAAAQAGEVVAIRGDCFDTSGTKRGPLKSGDAVYVGDMVEVPAPARLRLRMIDGSMLSAASGTTLTIAAYGKDASGHRDVALDMAAGLLRAVVAHVEQPSRFEVKTATGTAAVRSTDWFVSTTNAAMQVGVLDGRVALTSAASGQTVVIPPRWGARLQRGLDPVPPRVWSAAEFADVIGRTDVP